MRILIALIGLLSAFHTFAETSTDLPSAEKVIAAWETAIGGADAFLKAQTRTSTGKIDVSGMTGTITTYAKAPDRFLRVAHLDGAGVARAGYDGSRGWAQQPPGGLRELTGADLEARRRESAFAWEVRLPEVYGDCRTIGTGEIAGTPTVIVECTAKDQTRESFHFDAKSALMLRREAKRATPRGEITLRSDFTDYREVAGLRVPFSMKSFGGVFDVSISFEEIRFDTEIDDQIFAMPE